MGNTIIVSIKGKIQIYVQALAPIGLTARLFLDNFENVVVNITRDEFGRIQSWKKI